MVRNLVMFGSKAQDKPGRGGCGGHWEGARLQWHRGLSGSVNRVVQVRGQACERFLGTGGLHAGL